MPYKSAYKKASSTYRRKTYNKKKSYKPRSQDQQARAFAPTTGGTSIGRTLLQTVPLFPVRKYVKGQLYYEPYVTRSASLGALAVYNIAANGLYDPNRTATGHQPIGFDQMMLMYEQFCVVRAHIKVTAINIGSDATRVAIILSPDTGAPPSITAAMENGLLTSTIINGSGDSSGQNRMKTLQLTCDVPKYFGRSYQAVLADPLLSGTVSADPAEQVYFQICIWDPFSTSVSAEVAMDITVSYDTMYWEPRKLASS